MSLTREQILTAALPASTPVECPELGGTVHVRCLTAGERNQWEASCIGADGKPTYANASAKLVALGATDETGSRLFTFADVEVLAGKAAQAIERLADKIMELSGIGGNAEKAAEKNSEANPTSDSV